MESLESKLERLTPELHREVEDFVDFLLFRSGNFPGSPLSPQVPTQPQKVAPPPRIMQEPVHTLEYPPAKESDTSPGGNPPMPIQSEEPTDSFVDLGTGNDDPIMHDYIDYGQFEQRASPATVAVKKVKEKMQKREEQEKPRVMLDWID
jgi:hypothetical protein